MSFSFPPKAVMSAFESLYIVVLFWDVEVKPTLLWRCAVHGNIDVIYG